MKHKNPHILRVKFSFKRWFVSNVARHSSTWILPDMITIPNLRITPGTKCQQGQNWYPYLRMENLRNHAPHCAAYTYLAYLWGYPWGLPLFPKWQLWQSLTPQHCDSFWIELYYRTYLYSWLHIVNPFLFPLQEIMEKEISLSNKYLVRFMQYHKLNKE